jgi:hypothetical protein
MVLESPRAGRCSEFAIPMWRPPWPYSLHRNKSNNSVDGTTLPALSFFALLVDSQILFKTKTLVTMACDLPRETKIVLWGLSRSSFPCGARQAGTPIHWAESIHMLGSFLLSGDAREMAWKENRSACGSRRDVWRHLFTKALLFERHSTQDL